MSKPTCSADSCDRPFYARGWCEPHYTRWRRYGDPLATKNSSYASAPCAFTDCNRTRLARGLCSLHYAAWRLDNAPPCSVEGCHRGSLARGFCAKHYQRYMSTGDPLTIRPTRIPQTVEQVLARVDRIPPNANGCREGQLEFPQGEGGRPGVGIARKHYSVARVVLAAKLGRPIRPGHFACHTCDNPPCVESTHLWEGTPRDNQLDAIAKERNNPARGVRTRGAKLTEDQVREIRRSTADKHTLAVHYAVTPSNIHAILTRRSWAWVD